MTVIQLWYMDCEAICSFSVAPTCAGVKLEDGLWSVDALTLRNIEKIQEEV